MSTQLPAQLARKLLRAGIPVLLATLLIVAVFAVSASDLQGGDSVPADSSPSLLNNSSVITIGVSAAMTGIPEFGWRQVNAVQLAVDQVNDAGGIDIGGSSYTISLIAADSGCNTTMAITATNTLLDAGVVAVIGPTCSGALAAVQPLYAAAGVAVVSPSSTFPFVTDPGYTTTFRVISRDDTPVILLGRYFRNQLRLGRVAIVDGLNVASDAFENTFVNLGGTITSRRTVTSTADYTPTLTAIMGENPEAIFFSDGDPNNAGMLSGIAHGLGMAGVAIGWDTINHDRTVLTDYASIAGAAVDGDFASMHYRHPDDMPGYTQLNAEYQAESFPNYGDEAQTWGAFAYDAASIVLAAIERAGSTAAADIRAEIAATSNYEGVVGTYIGFDSRGEVIPQWAWLEQYRNGEWVTIQSHEVFVPVAVRGGGE